MPDMRGEDISTRPWASLSWPNRITLVRVALIAPFVVLLQYQQERPERHQQQGLQIDYPVQAAGAEYGLARQQVFRDVGH